MFPKNLLRFFYKESKLEVALLIIAGIVSFSLGFLILFAKTQFINNPQVPLVQEELRKFTKLVVPTSIQYINPNLAFIDPQSTIPNYQSFPLIDLQRLKAAVGNCQFEGKAPPSKQLKKEWEFHRLICQGREIPESMLSGPPFFSPDGVSYAYLTLQYLKISLDPSALQAWIQTHLSYFHLLELNEIVKNYRIDSKNYPLAQLIGLNWPELYQIVKGESVIIGDSHVLVSVSDGLGQYQVFKVKDWIEFWKNSLLKPTRLKNQSSNLNCFIVNSEICWEYDYNRSLLQKWNPITLFIVSLMVLTVVLFLKIAQILKQRKKEKEKLTFSLEMLTHELRTPLSSLAIQAEALRDQYEVLPAEAQMTCIRMLDQLAKVLRVTEASGNYLTKHFKSTLIAPKFIFITSLEDYFKSCFEPYADFIGLTFTKNLSVQGFTLDPYWTMICMTNLVRNALEHGQAPVRVDIQINSTFLKITVEDSGRASFDPKCKSATSQGMGLGLKLIDQILPDLLGQLNITFNPTRITITFKNQKLHQTPTHGKANEKNLSS